MGNLRKLRNNARKIAREEIESQENESLKASKSNCKPFWSNVKRKTKRTESTPNLTKEDGNQTVSDQEKAEMLSQFFSSISTHEEPGNWKIPIKIDCETSDMQGFQYHAKVVLVLTDLVLVLLLKS